MRRGILPLMLCVGILVGTEGKCAMAKTEPFFESGRLELGLAGDVELPNLAAGPDGAIYCVFSQNIQAIWLASTRDAGKTWGRPSRVMACPGPGYITDANALVHENRITVYATFVPKDPNNKFAHSQFPAASSTDGGATWSAAEPLPVPRRYTCGKTHVPVWLDGQSVVMGYSWEVAAEESRPVGEEGGMFLRSGVLISHDAGKTWTPGGDVPGKIPPMGDDEPALVRLRSGDLFMIFRTATPHPYEARSRDGGKTWETPTPSAFFGYNSPSALLRLRDGAILRSWDNSPVNRFPLVVSLSADECRTWSPPRTLTEPAVDEKGTLSFATACYPSLAEGPDGTVLAVWWERTTHGKNHLGYARFNRAWVEAARALPAVVAFGDSVTLGVRAQVNEYQTFRALLAKDLKSKGTEARVVNAGIGGSNSRDGLARLERDVLSQGPALVVVTFGINDAAMVDGGPVARTEPRVPLAEYRANLAAMVQRIRAGGAKVILCTPTPMSRAYPYSHLGAYATNDINYQLAAYADAARGVAREAGTPLVDLYRLFTERPDGLSLIPDGNHPYAEGHRLIAAALLDPVREALGE